MKKVTMSDIAQKMGISKSLVSLALNDKYGVSPSMRFEVLKCACSMGYDFNYKYRSKEKKNNIVVYIKNNEIESNPYWSELFQGSEKLLSEVNYSMILRTWKETDSKDHLMTMIPRNDSTGIMVINEMPKALEAMLLKQSLPIVYVDGKDYLDKEYDSIRTNNYLGGYLVAEHLISMGHKNLAFLGDKNFSISFKERYYGFRNYLDEVDDIKFKSILWRSTSVTGVIEEDRKRVMEEFKKDDRPDCVFAANDETAYFLYDILKQIGLKIPKDVSVVGFDDLPSSKDKNPPLSSIAVPITELGRSAVELLLYRIKHKDSPKEARQLSVNLKIRNSVRRI